MRLPRLTTRRWMMLAAAIALVLATWRCLERRATYLKLADLHAWTARFVDVHRQQYLDSGVEMFNTAFFESDGSVKPCYAASFERQRRHYAGLERKYCYAAAHPWLAVEADPPQPK